MDAAIRLAEEQVGLHERLMPGTILSVTLRASRIPWGESGGVMAITPRTSTAIRGDTNVSEPGLPR
jgi:hypothetical protein